MIEKAKRYVDRGFSAIKMQVAHVFTDEEDIINVRDSEKPWEVMSISWWTLIRAGTLNRPFASVANSMNSTRML